MLPNGTAVDTTASLFNSLVDPEEVFMAELKCTYENLAS